MTNRPIAPGYAAPAMPSLSTSGMRFDNAGERPIGIPRLLAIQPLNWTTFRGLHARAERRSHGLPHRSET